MTPARSSRVVILLFSLRATVASTSPPLAFMIAQTSRYMPGSFPQPTILPPVMVNEPKLTYTPLPNLSESQPTILPPVIVNFVSAETATPPPPERCSVPVLVIIPPLTSISPFSSSCHRPFLSSALKRCSVVGLLSISVRSPILWFFFSTRITESFPVIFSMYPLRSRVTVRVTLNASSVTISFVSLIPGTLLSAKAFFSSAALATFLNAISSANTHVGTKQITIHRVIRILSIRFFISRYLRVDTFFCVSR